MGFSVKGLFAEEKPNFRVLHNVLCLSEGVNFHMKIAATLRRREGPHRCRQLLLGEPEDSEDKHSCPPRWSVACLGEPLHLCLVFDWVGSTKWDNVQ